MHIRPLSKDDQGAIIELWGKVGIRYRPDGRDSARELGDFISQNQDICLGAYDGLRLVGVCLGSDDGRRGWINRLAVLPERQREGIARELLDSTEKALRKRGRMVICTLVYETNDPSRALFLGSGYGPHEDILYLCKRDSEEV